MDNKGAIQHLQGMSQRTSLRQKRNTEKMEEHLKERKSNKDTPEHSDQGESSDEEYVPSPSLNSTPSPSRETSPLRTPRRSKETSPPSTPKNPRSDLSASITTQLPQIDEAREPNSAANVISSQTHQLKVGDVNAPMSPRPPTTPKPTTPRSLRSPANLRTSTAHSQKELQPNLNTGKEDILSPSRSNVTTDKTSSICKLKDVDIPQDKKSTTDELSIMDGGQISLEKDNVVEPGTSSLEPASGKISTKKIDGNQLLLNNSASLYNTDAQKNSNLYQTSPPSSTRHKMAVANKSIESKSLAGIMISNLSANVGETDLISTFGIADTEYLKMMCSCKVSHLLTDDGKRFAIMTTPSDVAVEIIKLDGISLDNLVIEIKTLPLEFYELSIQVPNNNGRPIEPREIDVNLMNFLAETTDHDKAMLRCTVMSKGDNMEKSATNIQAIVATALQVLNPNKEFLKRIDASQYFQLLSETSENKETRDLAVRKKHVHFTQGLVDAANTDVVIKEVRNYNLNVCKQMKRKLAYLDRKNFEVRNDRGSTGREQLYIDCSTSIYEYFRFFLISTLKDKMNCTEDLSKRKVPTDTSSKRLEVEAQYSIQFEYEEIHHNIHITFYYTKCSLWLQGNSTKINNLTIAQFFMYNYIERIANAIEETVPLHKIGEALRERITSFLSKQVVDQITNGDDHVLHDDKCLTCPRNCTDNGKSMACISCKRKQHFNCASIRDEKERESYLSGTEIFTCSKCIHKLPAVESENFRSDPSLTKISFETSHTIENVSGIKLGECKNETPTIDESVTIKNLKSEIERQSILIRRLREEIKREKEEYTNKETMLTEEKDSLKEAYRRCLADCEKEKETKETLQKCVDALKQQNDNQLKSGAVQSPPLSNVFVRAPTKQIECRFYNRRNGCKNGTTCTFKHEDRPQCRNIDSCRQRNCKFDHKQTSAGSADTADNNSKACVFFNTRNGCKNKNCAFEHVLMPPCPNLESCQKRNCSYDHKIPFLGGHRDNKPPDLDRQVAKQMLTAQQKVQPLPQWQHQQLQPQNQQHLQQQNQQLQQKNHQPLQQKLQQQNYQMAPPQNHQQSQQHNYQQLQQQNQLQPPQQNYLQSQLQNYQQGQQRDQQPQQQNQQKLQQQNCQQSQKLNQQQQQQEQQQNLQQLQQKNHQQPQQLQQHPLYNQNQMQLYHQNQMQSYHQDQMQHNQYPNLHFQQGIQTVQPQMQGTQQVIKPYQLYQPVTSIQDQPLYSNNIPTKTLQQFIPPPMWLSNQNPLMYTQVVA